MLMKSGPEIPLTTIDLISHVFQTVSSYRQTIVNEKPVCKYLFRIVIHLLRRLLNRI